MDKEKQELNFESECALSLGLPQGYEPYCAINQDGKVVTPTIIRITQLPANISVLMTRFYADFLAVSLSKDYIFYHKDCYYCFYTNEIMIGFDLTNNKSEVVTKPIAGVG